MEAMPQSTWFELSNHAQVRAQQRGVRIAALTMLLDHYDRERSVGRRRTEISLSKRACSKLLESGVGRSTIESARSIRAIIADSYVITVYRA